jgi:hypothetical protein
LRVPEYFPNVETADLQIQPVNRSVLFLKDKHLITNYAWRMAIYLNTQSYGVVISTVRNDLMLVNKEMKEFTPVAE